MARAGYIGSALKIISFHLYDFENSLVLNHPSRILRLNDYLEGEVKITTDKIKIVRDYGKSFSILVAKDIGTA